MRARLTILLTAAVLLNGCYASRGSVQICDCSYRNADTNTAWTLLGEPPPNHRQADFWKRYFDRLVLMDPNLANAFSNSAVHWYQGADGETNACFVFQGSDRTNATVRLTPDHSAIEASIHGIPFGLDRSPWKKC